MVNSMGKFRVDSLPNRVRIVWTAGSLEPDDMWMMVTMLGWWPCLKPHTHTCLIIERSLGLHLYSFIEYAMVTSNYLISVHFIIYVGFTYYAYKLCLIKSKSYQTETRFRNKWTILNQSNFETNATSNILVFVISKYVCSVVHCIYVILTSDRVYKSFHSLFISSLYL